MGNLVAPRAPRAWNRCWSPWHQCPDAHHASSPAVPISSSARAGASTGGARSVADSVAATVGNYRGARPRTTWPPVSGPTGELAPRAAHPPVHQRRAAPLDLGGSELPGPSSEPIAPPVRWAGERPDHRVHRDRGHDARCRRARPHETARGDLPHVLDLRSAPRPRGSRRRSAARALLGPR